MPERRGTARSTRRPRPRRGPGRARSASSYSTRDRDERCAPIIRRIPNREIAKYRDDLLWLLHQTVEALDGLTDEELNWRPPAKDANSLLVLATHTLGAAEAHVLGLLAGQELDRVRASEFAVTGGAGPITARLDAVTRRLTATLDGIDPAELDRERQTPVGSSTGRECLLWAVRHAEQHHAVARFTRDLVLAARTG